MQQLEMLSLSLSIFLHTQIHILSLSFPSLSFTHREIFLFLFLSFTRTHIGARVVRGGESAAAYRAAISQHATTHCDTLQRTATHCNNAAGYRAPIHSLSFSLSHTLSRTLSHTHTHTQGLASRNEVIERQLVELKATYKEERADMEVRYQKDMKEYRAEAEHRCISRVLQPVVVCCSVLQCVVVCCSVCVLRCVCPVLQCGAVRCRVCVQWRRSRVLQFVAVCVPRSISIVSGMYPIATHIVSHIAYSSALHKGHGRVSRRGRAPVHLSCVAACCCVLLCVDERVSC